MKIGRTLAVLLVLGGCIFLYASRERKHREELDQLRQQAASLRTSLDEGDMRASVRFAAFASRERPDTPRSDTKPGASVPEQTAHGGTSSSAQPEKPRRELPPTEVSTHMDAAFFREAADREWSTSTRNAIEKQASAMLPEGASIDSVECRSSFCRVEMTYKDRTDFSNFTQKAYIHGTTHIWSGPTLSVLVSDPQVKGPAVSIAYLAREGHELPDLPE